MNKKLFIISVLIAIVVLYAIHVYKMHHAVPAPVPANPAAVAAAAAANKARTPATAPAVVSQNQQLINSYTAQIKAGKTDNGSNYYKRGLVYLDMQQYNAAIDDFTEALKIVPDSWAALYSRALAYQQLQMIDKAIKDLTAAIAAKHDYADAYNARGLMYVAQHNFDAAIADYNKAIALNPNIDQVYFNLGALYMQQKDAQSAKSAFDKAISSNKPAKDATPDAIAAAKKRLMESYLNRADAEVLLGDLNSSLNDATYVITNDPNNVAAYKLRAYIYGKLGNTEAEASDSATADNFSMQNMLDGKP